MAYESRNDLLSHKLTQSEVQQLLDKRRKGITLKALAEEFGVHRNTVINIVKRDKQRRRDAND